MAHHEVRMPSTGGHRVVHQETHRPIETTLVSIVYFTFGVIITLIALRFVLLLFGANPSAGFSQLVFGLSEPFVTPFFSVFGTTRVDGSTFEWSALLAIVVYALVAWGIASLIEAVTPRARAETAGTVEQAGDDAWTDEKGVVHRVPPSE